MLKRAIAWLVCFAFVLTVLPFGAFSVGEQSEAQRIRQQMAEVYSKTLASSGKESLAGFCGLMTSWQLYYLGITNPRVGYDGNDHYDAYRDCGLTSGGHIAKAYDASQYTLEEALNAATHCGTEDVYNILVGFQWTNTEAGGKFGHALVIHAILDGMVYFVEGFGTPFNFNPGGACVCTMEEFAEYFDPWTRFEGIVVFGDKQYTDFCQFYAADLFVEVTAEDVWLLDQPDAAAGQQLRQVMPGERLHATGVYDNIENKLYYRVSDGGQTCYVAGDATEAAWFNPSNTVVQDISLPSALKAGQSHRLGGKVTLTGAELGAVYVTVKDEAGEIALFQDFLKFGNLVDMSTAAVDQALDVSGLPEGVYTYSIAADVLNYYIQGNALKVENENVVLAEAPFGIGEEAVLTASVQERIVVKNGWVYEEDRLSYFVDGIPQTGWMCQNGINYYLREDGSATTGWAEINGKLRYFSATGAMRIGWLEEDGKTYYMLSNGVPATGWKTLEEGTFFFNSEGIMVKNCWLEDDNGKHYFAEDGTLQIDVANSTR